MPVLRKSVERLCEPGQVRAVAQPIVRTSDGLVVGYEALARMDLEPAHPPNWWLEQAGGLGLRGRLEIACLAAAAALGDPPADRMLFVNVSPSTLTDPAALALLDSLPARLVIEVTEQEAVEDYEELRGHLAPWRSRGVRFAVDDTGAGYSSLRHVIELEPDFLKLDLELVRDIDRDHNRRALVRAVVAFASEVGTSVIAEGVETRAELETLRDAEVHLVQGYLLAKPGPPWPSIATEVGSQSAHVTPRRHRASLDRLRIDLEKAPDQATACSAVVEFLFRRGQLMPSLYLEARGTLRCVAQRGLWQVLDGMPGTVGITGRTWKEGRALVIENVADHPDYLEAIPGVVAEMCVPIFLDKTAIGALNVESLSPLPPGLLETLEECARLLSDRLRSVRDHAADTAWQRAAQAATVLSRLVAGPGLPERLLNCIRDASGLDSACLVLTGPEAPRVRAVIGPLAEELQALSMDDLQSLSSLVGDIRSCYTAGDSSGRGFVGTDSLRRGGARAVAVLPLWARHQRLGSIVLAHSRPIRLSGIDIEPLEMLADTAASLLADSPSLLWRPGRPPASLVSTF
jgi:EAL domain-containing protein (putative c-di-GMP-specific phosphodiesterase class I)/putative methionine-R-sulfoxide reductase with GAF domain